MIDNGHIEGPREVKESYDLALHTNPDAMEPK